MTDLEPNAQQRRLIEGTDGVYLVDAGAGTGKTFAVTRRYATIIDQSGVDPEDVLLVTFTRSAATEMTERIVDSSTYGLRELADAPIRTFHAHCHDILQEHGSDAPTHLGIDDRITGSTRLLEETLVEQELFREFVGQFRDRHSEHATVFRALGESGDLLDVLKQLAAKGVFPTADGWYRDGETHLDGDFAAFKELFDAANEPRNDGRKQSPLRNGLSGFGNAKTYLPDAPSKTELRGGRGVKQLDESVAERVFDENREGLKTFLHDLYFEYLEFALERNYLNFGFLQLFAFVLLCEDHALRERIGFEYVMVDEFQDTSEIQFKLALLLADTDNLCVVGDWKQSIYSFQYADVANITDFEARLDDFRSDLNDCTQRVSLDPGEIHRLELTENYRSTQTILDFSEEALGTPATDKEAIDPEIRNDITSLSANAAFDRTSIEAIQHEDEHEAVLATVQRIVGNEDYPVEDENGEPKPPEYGDIAVLTRTRDYGRELLASAEAYDFPMAYDGGVELFRTDPAKLLLAWLRILESNADRGWAPVLERAGYTLDEVEHILSTEAYPAAMATFRDELESMDSVGSVARRVFTRYGYGGDYADVILHTIQSIHDSTTLTRGDLIQFIERAIATGATHDVHTSAGDDSVTVQTIHAAKGLEYPIVILANMNDGTFPPTSRTSSVIQYAEPVGLRQRKHYAEVHDHPHVYDNWRYDVFRRCLPNAYDEERRLLYVAMTRAEGHLVFAAGEEPNSFLSELPVEIETPDADVEPMERGRTEQAQLPFRVIPPEGPIGLTPHDLMDESVFEGDAGEVTVDGRGTEFGLAVHEFAEAFADGKAVTPSNADERRVKEFIDGLSGELKTETPARLPLDIEGDRVTISGIVDLVHITEDRVEIIDYKTDRTRRAEGEYKKQLSVYYHVLSSVIEASEVTATLYYTALGEQQRIRPLTIDELEATVVELHRG